MIMKNSKICILSMQKVNNFGSLLQSYSLKKIVEKLNCYVEFIDILPNKNDNDLMTETKIFSEEKIANTSKIKKIDIYTFNRIKIKLKDNKQKELFSDFRKNYLNISNNTSNDIYDMCIIGSDEVFNCCTNSKWGFTSQLFGNVQNAKEVISYAASCGSTTINDVNSKVKNRIKESFENMKSISVRDQNTYEFVSNLTNKKISINLDPVLIGNFDKEMELNKNIRLPKRYCILYSYYNRFNNKEEIKYIRNFCKNNNLKLITIGAPQFWIKKHLVLNPFEMLYAFSKADFIITDTFHGTIFASKYSNKFATIIRKSNEQKLSDLIRRINVEEHLCNNIYDIDEKYKINNDKEKVNEICEKEREKSIEYLNKNIKED